MLIGSLLKDVDPPPLIYVFVFSKKKTFYAFTHTMSTHWSSRWIFSTLMNCTVQVISSSTYFGDFQIRKRVARKRGKPHQGLFFEQNNNPGCKTKRPPLLIIPHSPSPAFLNAFPIFSIPSAPTSSSGRYSNSRKCLDNILVSFVLVT